MSLRSLHFQLPLQGCDHIARLVEDVPAELQVWQESLGVELSELTQTTTTTREEYLDALLRLYVAFKCVCLVQCYLCLCCQQASIGFLPFSCVRFFPIESDGLLRGMPINADKKGLGTF